MHTEDIPLNKCANKCLSAKCQGAQLRTWQQFMGCKNHTFPLKPWLGFAPKRLGSPSDVPPRFAGKRRSQGSTVRVVCEYLSRPLAVLTYSMLYRYICNYGVFSCAIKKEGQCRPSRLNLHRFQSLQHGCVHPLLIVMSGWYVAISYLLWRTDRNPSYKQLYKTYLSNNSNDKATQVVCVF